MNAAGRWLIGTCAAFVLLAAGPASALNQIPADTYREQLGIRLWGSVAQLDLFAARVAIHDENEATQADSWVGSIPESDFRSALGGGLEVSYGFLDDVKLLLEIGGFGSAATGTFTGVGPNSVVDPVLGLQSQMRERVSRYPVFGQGLGATVLLRSFEWCRVGLTFRVGVAELAGAVDRATETGPLGASWTNLQLTGATPSVLFGVEWEWLSMAGPLGLPLTGWVMLGYRELQFNTITATLTDSTGTHVTGDYLNADGTHRSLDLSGPEVRIGLQIATSFALTP